MPRLTERLELGRCPHCSVDTPDLRPVWNGETRTHANDRLRRWRVYACARCGGLVTAAANDYNADVLEVYPAPPRVDEDLPPRAKAFLEQATASVHAPAGAVMLAASAVDAMLKAKGYTEGSLYARIDKAVADHLITADMGKWAHEVRLDANEKRHAADEAKLPDQNDARRAIEFTAALGTLLFVLPARVRRGLTK